MKKGIMFSLLTLAVIIPVLAIILVQQITISSYREKVTTEIRLKELLDTYESITQDLDKSVEIVAPRAISACVNFVINNGTPLSSATDTIEELMIYGTLNSNSEELMEGNTLPVWINKIKNVTSLRGFITDIQLVDVEVKPYDSWNLEIDVNLTINITEENGLASICRNFSMTNLVSIENFEDPLFTLKTFGRGSSIIQRSPYEGNYTVMLTSGNGTNGWFYGQTVVTTNESADAVENKDQKVLVVDSVKGITQLNSFGAIVCSCDVPSDVTVTYVEYASISAIPNSTNVLVDGDEGKVWYIDNLIDDIQNSFYHSSEVGASFLDRLEGEIEVQDKYKNLSKNTIGLEFFIDKTYISNLGLSVDLEKTNVDHLYFSEDSHHGKRVKGLEDTAFRIDEEFCTNNRTHAEIYGVDELLIE